MSRDKQIDEMVKVMCGNREAYKTCKLCKSANVNAIAYCRIEHYAECLAKDGYRKASDVAEQIFVEIAKLIHRYINDDDYSFGEFAWDVGDLEQKYKSEGADDD